MLSSDPFQTIKQVLKCFFQFKEIIPEKNNPIVHFSDFISV